MPLTIEETIEKLKKKHGPGEATVKHLPNGGFRVEYIPDRITARVPDIDNRPKHVIEWSRRNPCAYARFARKVGSSGLQRYYGMLRQIERESMPPKPKIALCCTVLNEGVDLERTIDSILAADTLPDEFVFIDDSSVEPIEHRVRRAFGGSSPALHQFRMPQRCGVAAGRTTAHNLADADLYIFIDAHMQFPADWLSQIIQWHHEYPDAILSTASTGFEDPQVFLGHGCRFVSDNAGFIKASWRETRIDDPCPIIPCIMGACYAVPKKTLDAIGGWGPCFRGFGMDEEWLSLRARLLGFDCRIINNLVATHRYDRIPNRTPAVGTAETCIEVPFNKHVIASCIFEDGFYEAELREPMMLAAGRNRTQLKEMLRKHEREIAEFRFLIQSRRKVSDQYLIASLGLPIHDNVAVPSQT